MAAQIINVDPSAKQKGLLGSFNETFLPGLQNYANSKLQEMVKNNLATAERNRVAKGIMAIPGGGYTEEMAQALAGLPAPVMQQIIKHQMEAPERAANASIYNQLGSDLGFQMTPQNQNAQPNQGQPNMMQQPQAPGMDMMQQQQPGAEMQQPQEGGALPQDIVTPEQTVQNQIKQATPSFSRMPAATSMTQKQLDKATNLLIKKKEISQADAKIARAEAQENRDFNAAYTHKMINEIRDSPGRLAKIKKLKKLASDPEMREGSFHQALSTFGINWQALKNPTEAEFDALTIGFMDQMKSIFGSRITDYDAKLFMRSLPTLMQTSEGRHRIIDNMLTIAEIADVERDAFQQLNKKYGREQPFDFEQQVLELAAPKTTKLWEKFGEISKPPEKIGVGSTVSTSSVLKSNANPNAIYKNKAGQLLKKVNGKLVPVEG